jgi:predicted small lipoprotein YifL
LIRRAALLAALAATTSCGARTPLGDQAYEPASVQ